MDARQVDDVNDTQLGLDRLLLSKSRSDAIPGRLLTDERVIARVTDGIYRQPGSALRELISNSYDADATWVNVTTDAPRFGRIVVEDNGNGMTPDAAWDLLCHIGGSPKRSSKGAALAVTNSEDLTLSPNGRKLIGKLGIGMFSVSQLTNSFQIITKIRGDTHQTVTLVNMRQFADSPIAESETEFEAGEFRIWRERAADPSSHGTTVVLNNIRPQARDILSSAQTWSVIDSPEHVDLDVNAILQPPAYFVGRTSKEDTGELLGTGGWTSNLPWEVTDPPSVAFERMVNCVWKYLDVNFQNPSLSYIFDNYLQTIWNLALSLPLPYIDKHVADEPVSEDWAYFYKLSNNVRKGVAEAIQPPMSPATLRSLFGLQMGLDGDNFRVTIDGVELKRPIRFRGLPATKHALTKPMIFVGSYTETFDSISHEVSAGPLSFEAYLFWTPKVAPSEHAGVLVRIHGSSGTLFDSRFFSYPVSEQTRLRQTICEVFVKQGLEPALNIDRESFNTAHPHMIVLARWIHSALRQLATAQKREAQRIRLAAKRDVSEATAQNIQEILDFSNNLRSEGEGLIPEVELVESTGLLVNKGDSLEASPLGIKLKITDSLDQMHAALGTQVKRSAADAEKDKRALVALTQLLAVYGVLDHLGAEEQGALAAAILGILEATYGG